MRETNLSKSEFYHKLVNSFFHSNSYFFRCINQALELARKQVQNGNYAKYVLLGNLIDNLVVAKETDNEIQQLTKIAGFEEFTTKLEQGIKFLYESDLDSEGMKIEIERLAYSMFNSALLAFQSDETIDDVKIFLEKKLYNDEPNKELEALELPSNESANAESDFLSDSESSLTRQDEPKETDFHLDATKSTELEFDDKNEGGSLLMNLTERENQASKPLSDAPSSFYKDNTMRETNLSKSEFYHNLVNSFFHSNSYFFRCINQALELARKQVQNGNYAKYVLLGNLIDNLVVAKETDNEIQQLTKIAGFEEFTTKLEQGIKFLYESDLDSEGMKIEIERLAYSMFNSALLAFQSDETIDDVKIFLEKKLYNDEPNKELEALELPSNESANAESDFLSDSESSLTRQDEPKETDFHLDATKSTELEFDDKNEGGSLLMNLTERENQASKPLSDAPSSFIDAFKNDISKQLIEVLRLLNDAENNSNFELVWGDIESSINSIKITSTIYGYEAFEQIASKAQIFASQFLHKEGENTDKAVQVIRQMQEILKLFIEGDPGKIDSVTVKDFTQKMQSQQNVSLNKKELIGVTPGIEQKTNIINIDEESTEPQTKPHKAIAQFKLPGHKCEAVDDRYNLTQRDFEISDEIAAEVLRIVENIHSASLQNGLKVIGFTSVLPAEGTTTVALISSSLMANNVTFYGSGSDLSNCKKHNVGISDRQSVLLIDAQFRNPSVHIPFGDLTESGLIDLIKKKVKFNSVVRSIENSNLKFIPAGLITGEQNRKIDIEELENILDEARSKFDYIFVDLPSILHYSEGVTLSKLCDAVVLVIRAGQTQLDHIEEAKHRLETAEVNILGSVLNRRGTFIPDDLYKLHSNVQLYL